jgi:hypothetical protein
VQVYGPAEAWVVDGTSLAAGADVVAVAQAPKTILARISRDTKLNIRLLIILLQEKDKIV